MKPWSERGAVERAGLYTRGSLYLLMWGFPAYLVPELVTSTAQSPGLRAGALVCLLLLVATGTVALRAAIAAYPVPGPLPWRSLLPVAGSALASTVVGLQAPTNARYALLFATTMLVSWALGGYRDARVSTCLVVLGAVLPFLAEFRLSVAVFGAAIAAFFVGTVRVSLWMLEIIVELDRARGVQSALAVAEERLRFSRDVHDVLGRRLSTIAVQAELSSALAARGDDSAATKMLEVRHTAHLALREARELARGYRESDLPQELDGARSLLHSAGIAMSVDVDGLPDDWHEPAAWVVRESVTNVLRHSSATHVQVCFDDHVLRVRSDGAPPGPDADGAVDRSRGDADGGGSGLAGLRERLGPVGARLEASREGPWFEVAATFPVRTSVQDGS